MITEITKQYNGSNKNHENRKAVKIKYIGNESKTLVNGDTIPSDS